MVMGVMQSVILFSIFFLIFLVRIKLVAGIRKEEFDTCTELISGENFGSPVFILVYNKNDFFHQRYRSCGDEITGREYGQSDWCINCCFVCLNSLNSYTFLK